MAEEQKEILGNEDAVNYLLKMKSQGKLFHGSPSHDEISVLVPKKTDDQFSDWNSDMAVYAYKFPVGAVLFAIYTGNKDTRSKDSLSLHWERTDKKGELRVVAQIDRKYKDDLLRSGGKVYVLSPKGFEKQHEESHQFKSKVKVEPLAVVNVGLNDFYALGGIIEWKN